MSETGGDLVKNNNIIDTFHLLDRFNLTDQI